MGLWMRRTSNSFSNRPDNGYWDAISPDQTCAQCEGACFRISSRGTEDPLIKHKMVQDYVDVLKSAGQTVEYVQVEGARPKKKCAFFD